MSIYPEKREGAPTGRFMVEVVRQGVRMRHPCSSKKEAKRVEEQMKAGVWVAPKEEAKGAYTLKDLFNDTRGLWKGDKDEAISVRRLEMGLDVLREVLKKDHKADDVSLITTDHIRGVIRDLEAKKRKGSTINRYLAAISKALTWAYEQEPPNTPKLSRMPKIEWKDENNRIAFYLSEEAEEQIRTELKGRGHTDLITIMDVQIATGMRISEVLDVAQQIRKGHKAFEIEKDPDGSLWYVLKLQDTKNGEDAEVPLPEEIGKAFLELIEVQGMPSYPSIYQRLKSVRVRLGLPTTQPTHAHRHTAATRLTKGEVPTAVVKQFMRHRNINTTLKYIQVDTAAKKQATRRLLGAKFPVAPQARGDAKDA